MRRSRYLSQPSSSPSRAMPGGYLQAIAWPILIPVLGEPWTIGYGSTGSDVCPGIVWTENKAAERLKEHCLYFCAGLVKRSPKIVLAPPRRIAAVLSWVYNCGLGNYRISTFKKRIDAGDWSGEIGRAHV